MRYKFDQIFQKESDGRLTPKLHIQIGGANLGPGITFGPGVEFGGVNIFDFEGLDVEAEEVKNRLIIRGFYKKA